MSIVPKSNFPSHNDGPAEVVGKYVHGKTGSYYLELRPDGNFVLFQDSEIMGTYEVNRGAITLFVNRRPITTARIENGSIVDDQGDRWIRVTAPPIQAQPEPPSIPEPKPQPKPQPEQRSEPSSVGAKLLGEFAPKLAQLTDAVLFDDIWERKELSKRDRSMITVAALVAMNRPDQLRFHLSRAVENGVRPEELIEAITHLAFYAGWPGAMAAMNIAKELLSKA